MNLTPGPKRPFNRPPHLIDNRLPKPGYVPATVCRGLRASPANLGEIEQVWSAERTRLADELRAHGEALQNAHWDWTNKAGRPDDWHCLVTVECDGQVQGVAAVENYLRQSRLTPDAWVVYVDYVETAPWNYRVPQDITKPAARGPRFSGVGKLLIAEAVRMSYGLVAGGRVGLHSLPQTEWFYADKCNMTAWGADPDYYNLAYFEYPDGVTAGWLTTQRFSA